MNEEPRLLPLCIRSMERTSNAFPMLQSLSVSTTLSGMASFAKWGDALGEGKRIRLVAVAELSLIYHWVGI